MAYAYWSCGDGDGTELAMQTDIASMPTLELSGTATGAWAAPGWLSANGTVFATTQTDSVVSALMAQDTLGDGVITVSFWLEGPWENMTNQSVLWSFGNPTAGVQGVKSRVINNTSPLQVGTETQTTRFQTLLSDTSATSGQTDISDLMDGDGAIYYMQAFRNANGVTESVQMVNGFDTGGALNHGAAWTSSLANNGLSFLAGRTAPGAGANIMTAGVTIKDILVARTTAFTWKDVDYLARLATVEGGGMPSWVSNL